MNRILVITYKYQPIPLANSICIQKIIDILKKQHNKIDILTYEDVGLQSPKKYNDCNIYYVKPEIKTSLYYFAYNYPNNRFSGFANKLATILNRIGKTINLPFYPLYSIVVPLRIYKKIHELYKSNKYDIIISVYEPFEGVLAGYWFKKYHPDVMWIMYTLDTFINHRFAFLEKKSNKNRWLFKFMDKTDMFLAMRSRVKEYDQLWFSKWKEKIIYTDIPLMKPLNNILDLSTSNEERWIYTGSLGLPHYRTDDLIKIFMSTCKGHESSLHFYSMGAGTEGLKEYETKTKGKIKLHGYVSHDILMKIYSEASILVSVKYSDQISAKIFEYMSYGKKIVHISGTPNDPDVEYLRHYPKAIILTPYKDSIETCANQLSDWLNSWTERNENMSIDFSYFEMNRPEYTANLILEQYNKWEPLKTL